MPLRRLTGHGHSTTLGLGVPRWGKLPLACHSVSPPSPPDHMASPGRPSLVIPLHRHGSNVARPAGALRTRPAPAVMQRCQAAAVALWSDPPAAIVSDSVAVYCATCSDLPRTPACSLARRRVDRDAVGQLAAGRAGRLSCWPSRRPFCVCSSSVPRCHSHDRRARCKQRPGCTGPTKTST